MRRLIAAITLAATALVLLPSAPVDAADPSAEAQFVSLINSYRGANGRAPLGVHGQLVAKAEAWAQHMASTGCLCHSSLPTGISVHWSKLGENVGYGGNVGQVHQALVNSAPHRANMLDPAFNFVGVGVAYSGSTLWVAEVFMQGDGPPAPPKPDYSPVGNLDQATRSGGAVHVRGWAFDPETSGSIQVHVYGSNGRVWAGATTANKTRSDIAARYPAYGSKHGFDVYVPASSGSPMCAFAINVGTGGNRLLGCRAFPVSPTGHLDAAARLPGGTHLKGWAVDPDTTAPVQVHVYENANGAAAIRADETRSDVSAVMAGYGASHGFDVTVGSARHGIVCAYGINVGPGSNRLLGCARMNANPRGKLDKVARIPGGTRVSGWSLDPDTTAPIRVHVYADGHLQGSYLANQGRVDVGQKYTAYGNYHGFTAIIPALYGNVCVYAINTSAGDANPLLGCRNSNPNPVGTFESARRTSGGTRLTGWAADPDTTGAIQVHVFSNGRWFTAFTANRMRSDVGHAHPGQGSLHGFDITLRGVPYGKVCVYAINVGHGTGNPSIGCRNV